MCVSCSKIELMVIWCLCGQAVVLRVFVAYLRVMRRLQTEYMLEPAGSHGG
jgi:hypothetical protein